MVRKLLGPMIPLAALVAGVLLAVALPETARWGKEGIKLFVAAFNVIAPYLILFLLAATVADHFGDKSRRRVLPLVFVSFIVSTVLAAVYAIILIAGFFGLPMAGAAAGAGGASGTPSILDHLAEGLRAQTVIAVVYGLFVGFALAVLGQRTGALGYFATQTRLTFARWGAFMLRILASVLKVGLPLLLFAAGLALIGAVGAAGDAAYWYGVSFALTVLLLGSFLGLYAVLVYFTAGKDGLRRFGRFTLKSGTPAWAASSSMAALPLALESARDDLEVPEDVSDAVLGIGAVVNLDGSMIGAFALVVTAAVATGHVPTFTEIALLAIPLGIVLHGIPGVPGGFVAVVPPIAIAGLGIPIEAAATYTAFFVSMAAGPNDQLRSAANVISNGALAILVHRIVRATRPESQKPVPEIRVP